jgi:hypothetical protein
MRNRRKNKIWTAYSVKTVDQVCRPRRLFRSLRKSKDNTRVSVNEVYRTWHNL